MSRKLYSSLLIPMLFAGAGLIAGCTKSLPEVIMAVPLCDCSHNPENPRSDCWEGYVCNADAACSHDGGLFDKCVPQGTSEPPSNAPSY